MKKLFDTYFSYTENSESPLVFHRWSMLTAVGAMLGRQYRLPFGEFNIYPNQYVMLIGDPGTRKSTAIKLAKKVLANAGYETFAAERTSKEKFLLDLEGVVGDEGEVLSKNQVMANLFGEAADSEAKEVFIVADEFNEFVGSSNLEFLSLLGSLWDWDDETAPFKQRLKTSRSVSIYQPTINILSGNTHAGFAEAFPPQALGQGFMSRLILVYGESSGKKLPFPVRPSDSLRSQLLDMLREIKHNVHGEASMTDKAREMLETIYRSFDGLEDVRFRHYSTRRFTHLLKLCLLSSACDLRTEITVQDVMMANTLLTFTEHSMPRAMGEFGKAKNADVSAKILSLLTNSKGPLDTPAIWKQCQSDLDRIEDLQKLLAGLVQANKVQYVHRRASSTVQGYLIVRQSLSNRAVYVDFSLLKESGR